MAVSFDKVKAGDTLYSRAKQKIGNTTMRTLREWRVTVISVDSVTRTAQCSWNGNRSRTYKERDFSRLFDWNMRNKDEAIIRESDTISHLVYGVTRRPKCKACKKRHASEACP